MRRFVTNDETALAFADKIKHFILLTLQLFRPEEVVEIDGAARRVLDKHDNADTLPGVASCRAGLQALPPFFSSLIIHQTSSGIAYILMRLIRYRVVESYSTFKSHPCIWRASKRLGIETIA